MDRLQKEMQFHDERFGSEDEARKAVKKFYLVNEHLRQRYEELVCQFGEGKDVLEYGCGAGGSLERWKQCNVQSITGIDISPKGIEKAASRAQALGMNARLLVMNAEQTDFDDDSFDLVAGTGILHHLDLKAAYRELQRILKPDGHAIFIEPMGHNPVINWYRSRTPSMRTEDEHPLLMTDLDLLKQYFHHVKLEFFSLFTLLAVPLRRTFLFQPVYEICKVVDRAVLQIPGLERQAWTVIIHASSPRKHGDQ